MIGGGERRTLPARRDVGGAEIVDHRNAGHPRQQFAVADPACQARLRRMKNRVSMKSDKIYFRISYRIFL